MVIPQEFTWARLRPCEMAEPEPFYAVRADRKSRARGVHCIQQGGSATVDANRRQAIRRCRRPQDSSCLRAGSRLVGAARSGFTGCETSAHCVQRSRAIGQRNGPEDSRPLRAGGAACRSASCRSSLRAALHRGAAAPRNDKQGTWLASAPASTCERIRVSER